MSGRHHVVVWLAAPLLPAAFVTITALRADEPAAARPATATVVWGQTPTDGGRSSGIRPQATADPDSPGAVLYANRCASCHGADGAGVDDRGPDIRDEGEASADFVLRTGRMPLADPWAQAERGPVQFTDQEIRQLVDFVGRLGDGPAIPVVDLAGADVANGGAEFRLNCAACHVASGSGTAVGDRMAPNLMDATPTEVAEAIIIGPGGMPVFGGFTEQDINDVAAYVEALQEEHSGGASALGGVGPVAEGLAAWLLGLLPIVALTRWIGRPTERRDLGAHPDEESPIDEEFDEESGADTALPDRGAGR